MFQVITVVTLLESALARGPIVTEENKVSSHLSLNHPDDSNLNYFDQSPLLFFNPDFVAAYFRDQHSPTSFTLNQHSDSGCLNY